MGTVVRRSDAQLRSRTALTHDAERPLILVKTHRVSAHRKWRQRLGLGGGGGGIFPGQVPQSLFSTEGGFWVR